MAASGYFSNNFATGYTLRVEWATNSQSVDNNSSTMTVKAFLVSGGASYTVNSSASKTITLTINGTQYSKTAAGLAALSGSQKKELFSKTVTIAHNSDGTKNVNISCSFGIAVTLSGTYYGSVSTSGVAALNTIPRASTATISGSANVGNTVTINTNRASTNFTHNLAWSVNQSEWNAIANGVTNSIVWTLPNALATAKTTAASGVVYLRCITYSGTAEIGRKVSSYKYYILESYAKPSVTISAAQVNDAGLNAFIRGRSTVTLTANATMQYGANAVRYEFTYGDKTQVINSTSGSASVEFVLPVGAAASYAIGVTVTDSRGFSATASSSITTVAYTCPTISGVSVTRGTYNGTTFTESDDGESVKIAFTSVITGLTGNVKKYKIEYKLATATTWSVLVSQSNLSSYTQNVTYYSSAIFSANSAYNVRITITDSFCDATRSADIATAFTLLDFYANGKAMAIGKVAESTDLLDIALQTLFRERVDFDTSAYFYSNIFDSASTVIRNGLAYYQSGGQTDANTTVEELFLSSNNTPTTDFWFVRQMFYGGKTETSNRAQVAICYSDNTRCMFVRTYNNGAWSAWKNVPMLLENGTNGIWSYKKWSDGTLEIYGRFAVSGVACTTALGNWYRTAVLTPTSYPIAFNAVPVVEMNFTTSAGTGAMIWNTTDGTVNAPPQIYLIRPTSASAVSGAVNISAKGKWR